MIIYLFLILSFNSFAGTQLSFIDACTKESTRISTPNGTLLELKIDNLDPNDHVEVTVTYRPAGILEDLKAQDQVIWHYTFLAQGKRQRFRNGSRIQSDGSLKVRLPTPSGRWMNRVEQKLDDFRIWDAEVLWIQPRARKAGSALSTYYRSKNNGPFFQLLSPGLCLWEEEAAVSSRLYENNSQTWMNIIREFSETRDSGSGPGITLGANNNTGGSIPLGSQGGSHFAWLFKDWQKQLNSQQIFKVERKYVLNKNESGIYTTRLSFDRHEARKYEWVRKPGLCGKYQAVSEGFLDIGMIAEDFIVIPKNFFGRPEQLRKFINTARPPIFNCDDSVGAGPEVATDTISSGKDGLLFYYQLKKIRGSK